MRAVITIAVALLIAVGVYYIFLMDTDPDVPVADTGGVVVPADDTVALESETAIVVDEVDTAEAGDVTVEATEAEPLEIVEGSETEGNGNLIEVEETAEAAAADTETALETAAEETAQAAEETGEAIEETAEAAGATLADAAEETGEAIETTAEEGVAAADAATDEAQNELEIVQVDPAEVDTGTTDTAAADDVRPWLTAEGFDFERATETIEDSDLSDDEKTVLRNALNEVRDDPAEREAVLEQIRDALQG